MNSICCSKYCVCRFKGEAVGYCLSITLFVIALLTQNVASASVSLGLLIGGVGVALITSIVLCSRCMRHRYKVDDSSTDSPPSVCVHFQLGDALNALPLLNITDPHQEWLSLSGHHMDKQCFTATIELHGDSIRCDQWKRGLGPLISYGENRVTLKSGQFIEASELPLGVIACSAPFEKDDWINKNDTIGPFWDMVVEKCVSVIVMGTKLIDHGREQSAQYWPQLGQKLRYGTHEISLRSEVHHKGYAIREMRCGEHSLMHIHLSDWKDETAIAQPLLHRILAHVHDYRGNGSALFHCRAGVGRTGALSTCYLISQIFEEKQIVVNPRDLVQLLRTKEHGRPNFVSSFIHYQTIISFSQSLSS